MFEISCANFKGRSTKTIQLIYREFFGLFGTKGSSQLTSCRFCNWLAIDDQRGLDTEGPMAVIKMMIYSHRTHPQGTRHMTSFLKKSLESHKLLQNILNKKNLYKTLSVSNFYDYKLPIFMTPFSRYRVFYFQHFFSPKEV